MEEAFILGSLSKLLWINEFTVSSHSNSVPLASSKNLLVLLNVCWAVAGIAFATSSGYQLPWELVFAFSAGWAGALTGFCCEHSCNEESGVVFMSGKPSQCTHSCTAITSLGHSQCPDKGNTQGLLPFCGRLWNMCSRCKVLAKTS